MLRRAIGPRQNPRRGLAHMANAQSIDEAVKGNAAPLVDGVEQFFDAGLTPPLAVLQFFQ